jgi:hypothetical protein
MPVRLEGGTFWLREGRGAHNRGAGLIAEEASHRSRPRHVGGTQSAPRSFKGADVDRRHSWFVKLPPPSWL